MRVSRGAALSFAVLLVLHFWSTPAVARCTPCIQYCVNMCGCVSCSPPNCRQCDNCNIFSCNCAPCLGYKSCVSTDDSNVEDAQAVARAEERCRRMFSEMDTNKNKSVSKTEFAAWAKAHRTELESRTRLSSGELFDQHDKNADRRLTIDEAGCDEPVR